MRYRNRVLALLFLLSIITFLDRVCISVAGPRIQKDLSISPDQWGWVVGVFAIAYGLFEIPTGAMGDRIGPRKVMTRIVLWWSAFTALTGAVSNYNVLLGVRFLFGAGEAGAYPNSASAIARWFPITERARAQGIVWMASRLGGALSGVLVVPIQRAYGWRASFFIFALLGVVWAAVWYAWFRDRPRDKPGVSAEEFAEIGVGATESAHHGLPWRVALRSANFWVLLVMYHTYCYGGYFYLSWLHTWLQRGRGFSESEIQFVSMLPFVCGATANLLGGFASDYMVRRVGLRWGRRSIGMFGLSASALFTLGAALTHDKNLAVIFIALGYAGSDFMLPSSWAVCLDIGRKYAGAVSGTMNMSGQMGSFLSSVMFGYVVSASHSYDLPLIPIAAMLAISAVLWLKIDATKQLIPEPVALPVGVAH